MHRPSAEKEWQQPHWVVLPMVPGRPERLRPLEVQAASYLAGRPRSSVLQQLHTLHLKIEHLYYYYKLEKEEVKGSFGWKKPWLPETAVRALQKTS